MINLQSLRRAVAIQEKIEALQAELRQTIGSDLLPGTEQHSRRGRPPMSLGVDAASPKPRKKRRKLSPEALEKIREGQRKRWAAVKKAQKAEK